MLREFHFEQRSHLLTALTAECQDILAESLSKHGAATLLVSGGQSDFDDFAGHALAVWGVGQQAARERGLPVAATIAQAGPKDRGHRKAGKGFGGKAGQGG